MTLYWRMYLPAMREKKVVSKSKIIYFVFNNMKKMDDANTI